MIAALDVHYEEAAGNAVGAAVVFGSWEDSVVAAQYVAACVGVHEYVPGELFKRELPCLLSVQKLIAEPLDCILVDGYVWLGEKPGLGMRLWEALGGGTPVIGVAKTRFYSASSVEVLRGTSRAPLYVTAAGMDVAEAAANVARMAGAFRIPTMLRSVDRLARSRQK